MAKKELAKSSTAEYLTFIATTSGDETSYEMRYQDENIWLTPRWCETFCIVILEAFAIMI